MNENEMKEKIASLETKVAIHDNFLKWIFWVIAAIVAVKTLMLVVILLISRNAAQNDAVICDKIGLEYQFVTLAPKSWNINFPAKTIINTNACTNAISSVKPKLCLEAAK